MSSCYQWTWKQLQAPSASPPHVNGQNFPFRVQITIIVQLKLLQLDLAEMDHLFPVKWVGNFHRQESCRNFLFCAVTISFRETGFGPVGMLVSICRVHASLNPVVEHSFWSFNFMNCIYFLSVTRELMTVEHSATSVFSCWCVPGTTICSWHLN